MDCVCGYDHFNPPDEFEYPPIVMSFSVDGREGCCHVCGAIVRSDPDVLYYHPDYHIEGCKYAEYLKKTEGG